MTKNGWWVAGGVLAAVLVLVGGWFLGVSPMLASAATAQASAADVTAQNQTIGMKLAALSKTAAKQGELETQDVELQKAVPTILKPNTFSRRVYEVAALSNVVVDSWALGSATPYTAPESLAAPAPVPAATDGAASPSPSPSATASETVAPAPVSTAPKLALTDPLVTATNFAVVPVTMSVTGSQADVLKFASAIQDDERVMLITAVNTARNDDGTTTGALTGSVYTVQRQS